MSTPLLLVALGLLSAGRPTVGISVDGMFVHGTESGELVAASPRQKNVFAVRISDRPVFAAHRDGSTLVAEDDLGGLLLFDLERRALKARIPAATPGSGNGEIVATNGQVYMEAPGGQWVAHGLEAGPVRWRVTATGLGSDAHELLYAVQGDELRALAPSTGRPLFVHRLPGTARTSPAVDADGVLAIHAIADKKKRGQFIHGLSDWTHEAGTKPRWSVALGGAPALAPIMCGSAIGVLLEPIPGGPVRTFARFDRLDGRLIQTDEIPGSEISIRCARDLLVLSHRLGDGRRRLLTISPAGELLWERRDLEGWVGHFGDRFFGVASGEGLVAISAELGALGQRDRIDLAAEVTPLPKGVALRRFITSGEELDLPVKASVSIRLRVYRGAVLEPSVSIFAEDETKVPPGLRLSRDGLLFGRARGLGLYALPLVVALPGRPQEALALSFRLGPANR